MHGSLDLRLGHVLLNYKNVQNLNILHGLINESLFPFYTNLKLLLRLEKLPRKCMGLDLRLGQVS